MDLFPKTLRHVKLYALVTILLSCTTDREKNNRTDLDTSKYDIASEEQSVKLATKEDAEFVLAVADTSERVLYVVKEEALIEALSGELWPSLSWQSGAQIAYFQGLPGQNPVELNVEYKATQWIKSEDAKLGQIKMVSGARKKTKPRDLFIGTCINLDSKTNTKKLDEYLNIGHIFDESFGAKIVIRPYVYLVDSDDYYAGPIYVADVRKVYTYESQQCSARSFEDKYPAGNVWAVSVGIWPRDSEVHPN